MNYIKKIIQFLDLINRRIGQSAAWLILLLVASVFLSVLFRYVFSWSAIWLQDLNVYLHALLFIAVAGYTLQYNGHVRVDIFYQKISDKKKAMIEVLGTGFLLLPVLLLLMNDAMFFVLDSWLILEASQMSGGLPLMYIFKSFLLLLPLLLIIQGIAQILRAVLVFKGFTLAELKPMSETN